MASIRKKKFKAEVLGGHKDNAVEVPFDPVTEWKIDPRPLWRGRRGHPVVAKINGVEFESAIVPRQKKLYLLIDTDTGKAARVSAGAMVQVEVIPLGE
jgi:hypothetical protein